MRNRVVSGLVAVATGSILLAQESPTKDKRTDVAERLAQTLRQAENRKDAQAAAEIRALLGAFKARQALQENAREKPVPQERVYVVKKGDTFLSIAKRFGGSYGFVTKLIETNPGLLGDARKLRVGQTLKLPIDLKVDAAVRSKGFVDALNKVAHHVASAGDASDLDAAQKQLDEAEKALMAARRELWLAKERADKAKEKPAKEKTKRDDK